MIRLSVRDSYDNVLIGMDILNQCDFALWHDYRDGDETIYFELQQAANPNL